MGEGEVLDYLREQFGRLNRRLDDLSRWTVEADRRFLAIERRLDLVEPTLVEPT